MKLAGAMALWAGAPGCFYIDPIQDRDEIRITAIPSSPTRGGTFTVSASFRDQPDQQGTFEWSAHACQDPGGVDCGLALPNKSGVPQMASFAVPAVVGPMSLPQPLYVQSIRVSVTARDQHGALALGSGTTVYPVSNGPPQLELRRDAMTFTVGAPIELFARASDVDNLRDDLQLRWTVVAPITDPPVELEIAPASDDTGKAERARLVPPIAAEWDIAVTATDPLDAAGEAHLRFTIHADQPPCLRQLRPAVPPADAALPVTEPTRFQVAAVSDDLDSFPRASSDPLFGTTSFAWSILRPGAAVRELLVGATGSAVDFDPAGFTPGDVVELRVETFDRNRVPMPCPDGEPTCAITVPGCTQRQTWRLEAR